MLSEARWSNVQMVADSNTRIGELEMKIGALTEKCRQLQTKTNEKIEAIKIYLGQSGC